MDPDRQPSSPPPKREFISPKRPGQITSGPPDGLASVQMPLVAPHSTLGHSHPKCAQEEPLCQSHNAFLLALPLPTHEKRYKRGVSVFYLTITFPKAATLIKLLKPRWVTKLDKFIKFNSPNNCLPMMPR